MRFRITSRLKRGKKLYGSRIGLRCFFKHSSMAPVAFSAPLIKVFPLALHFTKVLVKLLQGSFESSRKCVPLSVLYRFFKLLYGLLRSRLNSLEASINPRGPKFLYGSFRKFGVPCFGALIVRILHMILLFRVLS